jgi:hypothetical protein
VFEFAASLTELTAGTYTLSIVGQDAAGDIITYLTGEIIVRENAYGSSTIENPGSAMYYDATTSDTRYARKSYETRVATIETQLSDLSIVDSYGTAASLPAGTNSSGVTIFADVYADGTDANNGRWYKEDASSTWVKVSGDLHGRVTVAEVDIVSIEAENDQQQTDLPIMIGEGFAVQPIVATGAGTVALAMEKERGKMVGDFDLTTQLDRQGIQGVLDETQAIVLMDVYIPGCRVGAVDSAGKLIILLSDDERISESHSASLNPMTDYLFLPIYGQSLAIGSDGGSIVSTSQPYNHVTFTDGVRSSDGVSPRTGADGLTGLVPLVEDDQDPAYGRTDRDETPITACANRITTLIQKENGILYTNEFAFIASAPGRGGSTVAELSKGASPDYYSLLLAHMTAAFDLSQAAGKTVSCHGYMWMQGENDASVSPPTPNTTNKTVFKAALSQLHTDINADIVAEIGQSFSAYMFTDITTYCAAINDIVAIGIYEFARDTATVCIAGPHYQLPHANDGLKVHLTTEGYFHWGCLAARAYKQTVYDGVAWQPLAPREVWAQGVLITVSFYVPDPPIVLDTTTLSLATDYGFVVEDDSGDAGITSVTVINGTTLRIVASRALSTNPKLRYALDNIGAASGRYLDIQNGASGNLRDSNAENFVYNGRKKGGLYNWAVPFEETITV